MLIKVRCVKDLSPLVSIAKNYGDMWQALSDTATNGGWEYCIKMTHLIHGVTKDFMCELLIPACEKHLFEAGTLVNLLEAEVSVFTIAEQPQRIR